MVKLTGDLVDIKSSSMPTTDHLDVEVKELYDKIKEMLNLGKGNDYLIVLGYLNTVRRRRWPSWRKFGLGTRNESLRGNTFIELVERRNQTIANTYFKHDLRYTWKAPGTTRRLQTDNILVKQRYHTSVKNASAYHEADCCSDHNLAMTKIKLRLKRL